MEVTVFVDTRKVLALSGASETDLKNWRRRKAVDTLPAGKRRKGTEWREDDVLHVCFTKALVDSGLSVFEANIEAIKWRQSLKQDGNEWQRYYARSSQTGDDLCFTCSDTTVKQLADMLSDEMAGYTGEPKPKPNVATSIVIIDRGEIVRRVSSVFSDLSNPGAGA